MVKIDLHVARPRIVKSRRARAARRVLHAGDMKKNIKKPKSQVPAKPQELTVDMLRAVVGGALNAMEEMRK